MTLRTAASPAEQPEITFANGMKMPEIKWIGWWNKTWLGPKVLIYLQAHDLNNQVRLGVAAAAVAENAGLFWRRIVFTLSTRHT